MKCFPLDATKYEADALGAWFVTRERGVLSTDDNFAVVASGSAMSVTLRPGVAWLKRAQHWGTVVWMEEPVTFNLDPADGTLSRIDIVGIQLDKDGNTPKPFLRKGEFSDAPVMTAPVRDAHADEIFAGAILVQPGAVKILQADVTDLRLNEEYCGIMRDGITQIPTSQLQTQVQQLIDELRRVISGIEAGSEVMLKAAYDTDGNGRVDDADKLAGHLPAWYAPPGAVIPYAGSSAPDGWLLCDGRTVSRTTYAALFAVIGTTYGAGDGKSTFALPNLQGRVAAGTSSSHPLASKAGADSKQITRANLPAEKLNLEDNGIWIVDSVQTGSESGRTLQMGTRSGAARLETNTLGSGTAFDVRQATLYLNYIIKY